MPHTAALWIAIACSLLALALTACSALSLSGLNASDACFQDLAAAYSKLDDAKSKGYSGKVEWGRAEAVLAEAQTEQESKHYDECISKVKEAEPHIEASLK